MTAILTSAIVATVAVIWIRKNVPPNVPPNKAIFAAIQKLAYKGCKSQPPEPSKTASKVQTPRPPLPPKDEPNVGGSYTGGFGSGMPFLDGLPGIGEPQPITTNVTFKVSLSFNFGLQCRLLSF